MENLRVLEGSKDFFRGLQHPDAPVQIRSAPLKRRFPETVCFREFLRCQIYGKNQEIF